jgi:hypothetical protein
MDRRRIPEQRVVVSPGARFETRESLARTPQADRPPLNVPIHHEVDAGRSLLLVKRSGTIATQDERAALDARRADPAVIPGIRVLVDCCEVQPPDSPVVVRYVASHVALAAAALRCGPVAIVVGSDVQFGMARMYQAMTELSHPSTRVFREVAAALTWLLAAPAEPGSG